MVKLLSEKELAIRLKQNDSQLQETKKFIKAFAKGQTRLSHHWEENIPAWIMSNDALTVMRGKEGYLQYKKQGTKAVFRPSIGLVKKTAKFIKESDRIKQQIEHRKNALTPNDIKELLKVLRAKQKIEKGNRNYIMRAIRQIRKSSI